MKHEAKVIQFRRSGLVGVSLSAAVTAICMSPINAFAAGIEKLNTTLNLIISALNYAGVAVITIAIAWAGYKLAFAHSSLQDIAKPFLGAILVGCAAAIAAYLLPSS
jgi:type IV secretion system protein VirB2